MNVTKTIEMQSSLVAASNGSVRRIRTPHPHDVLSGRGGGINGHSGNVQFREWVRVRKNDYNLAASKVEKARVAQDVIALVRQQNPPGRFLQRDPSAAGVGHWWVELDEERIVAKTSQALREGAPQIRAAHQRELNEVKKRLGRKTIGNMGTEPAGDTVTPVQQPTLFSSVPPPLKRGNEWIAPAPNQASLTSTTEQGDAAYQEKAILELRSNVEIARLRNDMLENDPIIREEKRLRMDEQGTAAPITVPPPLAGVPRRSFGKEQRQNSLALSEISFDPALDDFVNPFSDEVERSLTEPSTNTASEVPPTITLSPTPPPFEKMMRTTSTVSNDDFGGLRSLVSPPAPEPLTRSRSGQSVTTQVSKLDWEEGDPLLNYLTSLDRGVAAQ